MLVDAILLVIVLPGTAFLVYFFFKMCRDSSYRHRDSSRPPRLRTVQSDRLVPCIAFSSSGRLRIAGIDNGSGCAGRSARTSPAFCLIIEIRSQAGPGQAKQEGTGNQSSGASLYQVSGYK